MRTIGYEWRNLAEGLLRVEALQARFRFEWGPRLEVARKKRHEAQLRKLRERGHAALDAASVLAVLLFVMALALLLLYPPAVAFVLVLALVIPAVLVLYGAWALFHTPSPLPDPSDLSGQWWATISKSAPSARRSGPAPSGRRYEDVG